MNQQLRKFREQNNCIVLVGFFFNMGILIHLELADITNTSKIISVHSCSFQLLFLNHNSAERLILKLKSIAPQKLMKLS